MIHDCFCCILFSNESFDVISASATVIGFSWTCCGSGTCVIVGEDGILSFSNLFSAEELLPLRPVAHFYHQMMLISLYLFQLQDYSFHCQNQCR